MMVQVQVPSRKGSEHGNDGDENQLAADEGGEGIANTKHM